MHIGHRVKDRRNSEEQPLLEEKVLILGNEGIKKFDADIEKRRYDGGAYCMVYLESGKAKIESTKHSRKTVVKRGDELIPETYQVNGQGPVELKHGDDIELLTAKGKPNICFNYFSHTQKDHRANIGYKRKPNMARILSGRS